MPYNPQQRRPFNFNIDDNGLLELAKVADPSMVMDYLNMQAPSAQPANNPPYAEQQPPAWSIPAPITQAVLGADNGAGGSAPAPPTPLPEQTPLPPQGGMTPGQVGLGFQALSLLNSMNQPRQMVAPNPGFAPRPAQIQFQQFLPSAVNTRRPDLASIIYGRR